jgi:molecular chaperone HscB
VTQNFFTLLNLPEAFVVDLKKLDQHYQAIQKEIHPDRFASLNDEKKMESVKKTAQVNDAYQTLKSPIRRAEYLLHLYGFDINDEKYTAVPQDFLLQQMEWREELETHTKNKEALEKLASVVAIKKKQKIDLLPTYFDKKNNLPEAIKITRELNFIEKIEQHISDALIEIS